MTKFRYVFALSVLAIILLMSCVDQSQLGSPAGDLPPNDGSDVPASQTASLEGNGVVEAVSDDAKSFHIYQATDITSRDYQFKVYASGLWQRDPTTNLPIPHMAKSWSQSDDGKTYTFDLRRDMKWSDGVPITAQDFIWTYQQAINPDNNYPFISILESYESYTAPDDYTIVVTFADVACTSLVLAGQITPLPKHIWEKLDWSDPQKNSEIINPTVISGPWKLKEWIRDEYAIFEPNESYFGDIPELSTYTIRIVPQASVRLQMLKNGEIDYASVGSGDFTEAQKLENLTLYQWTPAQPLWYFVGFNLRRAALQDVELRHALAHAMPQQLIAERVFQNLAKPMHTTYSPGSWAYNSDVRKYDYDPTLAQQILDKAGYELDMSGQRLDKDGQPLSFKLYVNSSDGARNQIALIAQEEFKRLGITIEVIPMEGQALYEFQQKSIDEWDMWVGLSRDSSDPHFAYQLWSESMIPQVNTGAYINKEVEDLFAQGNRPSCSPDDRKNAYDQIQETISEDTPYIFLVYSTGYAFVNKRVIVNPPTALGVNYQLSTWKVQD